jgi:8-oxo-dGTP pyrophosphatase MutT (NUDIX family)
MTEDRSATEDVDAAADGGDTGDRATAWVTVAARGIVRHEGRLLLVSDGDGYWYAPGGRMEPGESLPQCLVREVHEETGLHVQVGDVLAVSEYLDSSGEHKIECFFGATLRDAPDVLVPWQDRGGPVTAFGLFSDTDLVGMDVRPAFVATAVPGRTGRGVPVYIPPASGAGTARRDG